MTCHECTERTNLLAASEQLLAEKRFKYAQEYRSQVGHPIIRARLLGDYEHAVKTARANLEHHRAEHERESR